MLLPGNPAIPRRDEAPEFFKMAGAGNDFVIVDNRSGVIGDAAAFARKICTRRLSVGADGLILVEPSQRATFRMRYYNSDGSRADFCANGTRCAARFAFLNVIAPRRMTIETDAGVISAEIHEQLVTLMLAPPSGFVASRPLTTASGLTVRGSYIRVGVPHYVIYLRDSLWEQEIESLGRELRRHRELQPDGANVNFVVVRDTHSIEVRTYERGVEAETLACGSGVTSSALVSALLGRVESPVSVLTRSGITLTVEFTPSQPANEGELREIRLTGDARVIYRAKLQPETIDGFDADWVREPTEIVRAP